MPTQLLIRWRCLALAYCAVCGARRLGAQDVPAVVPAVVPTVPFASPAPGTRVRIHLARAFAARLPGLDDGVGVVTLLRADSGGVTVRLAGGWTYVLPADAVRRMDVRRGSRLCRGGKRVLCVLTGVAGGAAGGLVVGTAIGTIHLGHPGEAAALASQTGERDTPPATVGALVGGFAGFISGVLFDGQRWAPVRGWTPR